MPSPDRNLLFGLIALQVGLIDRGQLVAAFQAWALDKSKPLADHLPALDAEGRAAVDALAALHLKKNQGDPERSLASLPIGPSTRDRLATIGDPELHASLDHVHVTPTDADDPGHTVAPGVGAPTSAGLRFVRLRRHARGGLGEVFVARDNELNREVALKEIRDDRDPDDHHFRQRFRLEAEITGGLEHPGIVPVYGLGTYPDGRPFYAMRLIGGDTLKDAIKAFHATPSPLPPGEGARRAGEGPASRISDLGSRIRSPLPPGEGARRAGEGSSSDRSLALRSLLRRLTDVCNALEYAHDRGVLHRDIKPGNIIVGKYGETLVVDWGLAKAKGKLEADSAPTSTEPALQPASASGSETMPGSAVGTPAYMSPEQARGDLSALGPRSDVYSLGATLYSILTGHAPIEADDLGMVLQRAQKGDFPPPRQLDPAIDKSLEAVCLKALSLRPEDRYPTCRALADDLDRWLADEPVSARPEPLRDRARRWARKHRTLVTTAAATVLLGAIGAGLIAYQQSAYAHTIGQKNLALQDSLDREQAARSAERQARDKALTALRTLTDDIVENQMARADTLTDENRRFLGTIIEQYEGLASITADDADSRALRAEGLSRVGLLRDRLGDYEGAEAAHRAALAIRERLAADLPARPESRRDLAKTHGNLGLLLSTTGRYGEAEAAHRAALAIQRRLAEEFAARSEFRQELAASQENLGNLLGASGRHEEAEAVHREALAIQRRLAADFPERPEYRQDLAGGLNNLGLSLQDAGRLAEAEAAFAEALEIKERLAADSPARPELRERLARGHNNLGRLLGSMGRYEESETAFNSALVLFKQLAAEFPARPDLRRDLARSHNNLAVLFAVTGRLAEAESSFAEVLAIQRRLAADFPDQPEHRHILAGAYVNLAILCNQRGDYPAARAHLDEAGPHHEAVLEENPRSPAYREAYRSRLWALAQSDAGLLDPAAALDAAEAIRDLDWDPPADAYYAAGALAPCVPIVARHERLDEPGRAEAVRFYADHAMAMLRDAVAKGYRDAARMKQDTDLDPLRSREDFQQLLAELEAR